MMTMKSMKYQECDTIMDNYNPVPPPLPRRVPPVRNIYAEPFETNPSRWVQIGIKLKVIQVQLSQRKIIKIPHVFIHLYVQR